MADIQATREQYDLRLRPHHVTGFFNHERWLDYYTMSEKDYLALVRQAPGVTHSDRILLHWRYTYRRMHENPDIRVLYDLGSDSVCAECEANAVCNTSPDAPQGPALSADAKAAAELPQLIIGRVYTARDLAFLGHSRETIDGRFITHGDGTITDTQSGLMWTRGDNGQDVSWGDAASYCNLLRLGGHADWRLPTIGELRYLFDLSAELHISNAFETRGEVYWTSIASEENDGWRFWFRDGVSYHGNPNPGYRVLAVRDPQQAHVDQTSQKAGLGPR